MTHTEAVKRLLEMRKQATRDRQDLEEMETVLTADDEVWSYGPAVRALKAHDANIYHLHEIVRSNEPE